MVTLPDYTALGERPVPRGDGGVVSYDPTVGRGLQQAGQGIAQASGALGQASNILASMAERQDAITALDAANKLKERTLLLEKDPKDGFSNKRGNAVTDEKFVSSYQEKFDAVKSEIESGLNNESAKKTFNRYAEINGLQFQSALLHHKAIETLGANNAAREAQITLSQNNIAAHPFEDNLFYTEVGAMGKVVMDAAADRGLTGKEYADFVALGLQQVTSKALVYRTNGILLDPQGGPKAASEFFHEHEQKGEFTANDRMDLAPKIQANFFTQRSAELGKQAFKDAIGAANNVNLPNLSPEDNAIAAGIAKQVKAPHKFDPLIEKYAMQEGISPTELKLRMITEGGGQDNPTGYMDPATHKPVTANTPGAVAVSFGPMQFTKDTAKRFNIDPTNAEQSIAAAAKLMAQAGGTAPDNLEKLDRVYYGGNPAASGTYTQKYVEKLKAARQYLYGVAEAPMTQTMLEGSLGAVQKNAEAQADLNYPNDIAKKEHIVAEATKNWSNALAALRGQNEKIFSDVMAQFASPTPPKAMSDFSPSMIADISKLPGMQQERIKERMQTGSQHLTQENSNTYYKLLSMSGDEDKTQFLKTNLPDYFGKMPDHLLLGLMGMQKSINAKDAENEANGVYIKRARQIGDDMIKPMVAATKGKPAQEELLAAFHGRLDESVMSFRKTNDGKWPDADQMKKMSAALLATGTKPGSWWGTNPVKAAFLEPSLAGFNAQMPAHGSDEYKDLMSGYVKKYNKVPTDAQLQEVLNRMVTGGLYIPDRVKK